MENVPPDRQGQLLTLPYGDTLHFPGCGCPPVWRAGTRPADFVDFLVGQSYAGFRKRWVPVRPLNIAYMLPHHNVTGGMKCLCEHIRLLRARGHKTIAIHRSDTAVKAMPPWTDIEADVDVVCKLHQCVNDVFPVGEIDCVVVGIFHQVAELLLGVSAPIIYWEQGHEWLFGDPVRHQTQHNYVKQDALFHMVMHLPVALGAVSKAVQAILKQEFGRSSLVIPNSVDCHRFSPGPLARLTPTAVLGKVPQDNGTPQEARKSVLLVGNPSLPLKGFDVALKVLSLVNNAVPISVTWVCQTLPSALHLPGLTSCGLCIKLYVSPPQDELPSLYRGHDAFLFTSRYEAWGMPVLEAMASGVPVVSTRCMGVDSFARPGENALLADPQDVVGLASHLLQVLLNASVSASLAANGRETACAFTPDAIADRLEGVLYSLTAVSRELFQLRSLSIQDMHVTCSWASASCSKTPNKPHQASSGV